MHHFLKFIFGIKLYIFRTVLLSIIRRFSLYTQQWYMSYRFVDSWQETCMTYTIAVFIMKNSWWWTEELSETCSFPSRSCSQDVSRLVWHIPLLCVQWKTADDGQRNCPKRVEFYSKNKFEKLVHLVGFIVIIYHDARSPERQIECTRIVVFRPNDHFSLYSLLSPHWRWPHEWSKHVGGYCIT